MRLLAVSRLEKSPLRQATGKTDAVTTLVRSLDLPTRLRDVGVPATGLLAIAEATRGERSLKSNPRPIEGTSAMLELLREAW